MKGAIYNFGTMYLSYYPMTPVYFSICDDLKCCKLCNPVLNLRQLWCQQDASLAGA